MIFFRKYGIIRNRLGVLVDMIINLKSFSITNYDNKVSENVKFLEEIKKDEEITKNLEDVPDSLERSIGLSNLRLNISYLVKQEEAAIGLVRLAKKNSNCHDISVDIAIHPLFRRKGYGTILLKEISDYILTNSTLIKNIKLDIASSNKNAAKLAAKANFKLEGYVELSDNKGHLLYCKHK